MMNTQDIEKIIRRGERPLITSGEWEYIGCGSISVSGETDGIADGNANITAHQNAKVRVCGRVRARAYDRSQIKARNNAEIDALGGDVEVEAAGRSTVRSRNSRVKATGNAIVYASLKSEVEAKENSKVFAYDFSRIKASDQSVVHVHGRHVTVEASGGATIILFTPLLHAIQIAEGSDVIIVDRVTNAVDRWRLFYGAQVRDGKLVLYKWASPNGESSNGFKYIEGLVAEAPDWDPDPNRECGGGLRACASLEHADSYWCYDPNRKRVAIELLVDPSDCRDPHPYDDYPNKIRFKKAFVSRVWDEDKERIEGLGLGDE